LEELCENSYWGNELLKEFSARLTPVAKISAKISTDIHPHCVSLSQKMLHQKEKITTHNPEERAEDNKTTNLQMPIPISPYSLKKTQKKNREFLSFVSQLFA